MSVCVCVIRRFFFLFFVRCSLRRRHVLLQEPPFLEVQRPAHARGPGGAEIGWPLLVQLHRANREEPGPGRRAQEDRSDGQKRTDHAAPGGRPRCPFLGRPRRRPPTDSAADVRGRFDRVRRPPLVGRGRRLRAETLR